MKRFVQARVNGGSNYDSLGVGEGEGGDVGGDVVGGVRQWGCTMCREAYTTFTGMRLHQRRAHEEEFNRERLTVGMDRVSIRWGQQEKLLFAMAEASLVIRGVSSWHINHEMALLFHGDLTMTEARIKGRRKTPEHKRMVPEEVERSTTIFVQNLRVVLEQGPE